MVLRSGEESDSVTWVSEPVSFRIGKSPRYLPDDQWSDTCESRCSTSKKHSNNCSSLGEPVPSGRCYYSHVKEVHGDACFQRQTPDRLIWM